MDYWIRLFYLAPGRKGLHGRIPTLGSRGLTAETNDLSERGMVDAIIVSGEFTGSEAKSEDVDIVRENTTLPLLI